MKGEELNVSHGSKENVNLILRYFYLAHTSNFSRGLTGKSWLISLQGHSAFEGWYFWHASKFESHLTALSIWVITIFSPFVVRM